MFEKLIETKIGPATLVKLEERDPLEKRQINVRSPFGDIPAFVSAGEEGTLAIEIGNSTFEIRPKNISDFDSEQIITASFESQQISFRVEWLKDNPQGEALILVPVPNSSDLVAA